MGSDLSGRDGSGIYKEFPLEREAKERRESEIEQARQEGKKEIVEWIIKHKVAWLVDDKKQLTAVTSARWTYQEWQELKRGKGIKE